MIIAGKNGWPVWSKSVPGVDDYSRKDRFEFQIIRVYDDELLNFNLWGDQENEK